MNWLLVQIAHLFNKSPLSHQSYIHSSPVHYLNSLLLSKPNKKICYILGIRHPICKLHTCTLCMHALTISNEVQHEDYRIEAGGQEVSFPPSPSPFTLHIARNWPSLSLIWGTHMPNVGTILLWAFPLSYVIMNFCMSMQYPENCYARQDTVLQFLS